MMASYQHYKDSGNHAIGMLPINWDTEKIKFTATLNGRIGWQGLTSDEYSDTGAYLITGINFNNGKIDWESCVHVPFERWEEAVQIQIKEGDLLITKDGTVGKVAMAIGVPGKTSLNSGVLLIRLKDERYKRFLFWTLQSPVFSKWYSDINLGNSTILHLYQHDFYNFSYPKPEVYEANAIADYLDDKVSRIDQVIAEAKASIEEYKALKASVIYEAVTKGLDPNAEMKDSGVKWIGKMPSHWQCLLGKALFHETNVRSITGEEELLTVSHITGITPRSQKNVNMFMATSLVDYKICEIGDIAANTMWMWQGAVGVSSYRGVISPSYNTYRQNKEYYTAFFLDCMLRNKLIIDEYIVGSSGITASRLRLYPEGFLSIKFPLPPYEEQLKIEQYLMKRCSSIDSLISEKESLIADLEAYKKSLIYEVVTGKRKVV